MLQPDLQEWRDHIILSRDCATPGERTSFFLRVRHGDFVPLYRGVYVATDEWRVMDRHAQYRCRVKAAAAFYRRPLVFSHQSAAALWRLPSLGAWPTKAHVVEPSATGGRSSTLLVSHTVGVPAETVAIDGIVVTTLARTTIDLARTLDFGAAVVVADAALRRTRYPLAGVPRTALTPEHLREELSLVAGSQGAAKALRVVDFADGAADRPGESISRVNMHLARLSAPRLQVKLRGRSGQEHTVDFWWEEFNGIGEFDGKWKYTDPEFRRGRTPEQVLYDEKLREDDLRGAGYGFTRWPWEVAISMPRLRAQLLAAGIR